MRVVFVGTPEFAVPSLKALLSPGNHGCEVVAVITQPDRPAGRGMTLTPPPVKLEAEKSGVPVFQPQRLRNNPEAQRYLEEKAPQLIVVAAFGQILPEAFFRCPSLGSMNVHPSLLPKYRGAGPVAHAVLNGETTTGVTIMLIDEGMDTGDILSQTEVSVGENTTGGELETILAQKGAELLVETIPPYASGQIQPQPQDPDQASYAPMIKKKDGRLDWSESAGDLHNRIRALNPWPGAFATFRGETVKIWCSRKAMEEAQGFDGSGPPGTVVAAGPDGMITLCGQGTFLSLQKLQLPNRKRISAADFVNGVNLKVGERFA